MEENDPLNIELKSEPMNEMLSHPPSWIVRSGSSVVIMVLMIVLLLSWFIEYPDQVEGTVTVSNTRPPIELSNQTYVQLKALLVNDGQQVTKGELLAQFDDMAKAEDIRFAEAYLQKIRQHDFSGNALIAFPDEKLLLGSYNEKWSQLEVQITEWNLFVKDHVLQEQITSLEREVALRRQLQQIAEHKVALAEKEYAAARKELESSEKLYAQHAISGQEYNRARSSETQAGQSFQGQREQQVQNAIQLNSLTKEISKLHSEMRQKEQSLISGIETSVASLLNGFRNWENNAVWKAPCKGYVLFNTLLHPNNFYAQGKASLVVVPDGEGYVATAVIPEKGSGNIRPGQLVMISLNDFPENEYGMLEGTVSKITAVDKEGKHEVLVHLPPKLITTYGKTLPARAQLKGQARIITKKKKLLYRFFESISRLIA